MKTIDMRSDTVTRPTEAMRAAMAAAEVGDDVYEDDPTTLELERLAAETVDKEAALFVPSGTFGNQLALFTHCRRGEEVIIYDDCHIVVHEAGAAAVIAGVQLRTLEGPGSLPDAEKMRSRVRRDYETDIHYPRSALICLENAHSDGKVIPLENLAQVRSMADGEGLPIHMDGARVFNAASYLGVDVKEIARYTDSLMFCLSKGLCAPIGSMLCGSREFVALARRRRKTMGGGMRQTGILAAAGIIAIRDMTKRLEEDRVNARHLSELLSGIPGVKAAPEDVHINLVFLSFENPEHEAKIMSAFDDAGILANPPEDGVMRLATHYWISRKDVEYVADVFKRL